MIMGAERSTLVSFCYEMVVDFDYFGGVQTLQSDRQQLLRRKVNGQSLAEKTDAHFANASSSPADIALETAEYSTAQSAHDVFNLR